MSMELFIAIPRKFALSNSIFSFGFICKFSTSIAWQLLVATGTLMSAPDVLCSSWIFRAFDRLHKKHTFSVNLIKSLSSLRWHPGGEYFTEKCSILLKLNPFLSSICVAVVKLSGR